MSALDAPAAALSRKRSNLYLQYRNSLTEESVVKASIQESNKAIDEQAKTLGRQLHSYLGTLYPSTLPMEDMQLQTARKIRQLLQATTNQPILQLFHQHSWLSTLLDWLNCLDRPAVQMETLLLLTRLAEVCAQSTYGTKNGSLFGDKDDQGASRGYPYLPTPPLSFSSTLSKDALAAFDASIAATVQQQAKSGKGAAPAAPPSTQPTSPSFLPPPSTGNWSSFPHQQLSSNGQYLLLRHTDAIPTLISLLTSCTQRDVYEQAVCILGTIAAGDSGSTSGERDKVSARDVILAAGVMTPLLRCMERHPQNLTLQRIGSWTLSHLVEGIFQQPSKGKDNLGTIVGGMSLKNTTNDYSSSDEIDMAALLPVLSSLLKMADADVLSYTCWTLSHLCDGPASHISAVVTTVHRKQPPGGLVPRLVDLLGHSSWRVQKPSLRTIGNIVCAECAEDTSPADYTDIILECEAVPKLRGLVTHQNREIQKEACWTLSNIAAGTVDQIQAVIDSGAIPPLVKLVSDKTTDQEVRSEACWVVLNATSCGSDGQIEILVDEGCVSVLGVLLDEPSMVMMALEGLERVLQVEEARENARSSEDEENPILVSAALIEKALDKHNSSGVTKRATRIWKQHFVSCALCNLSFSKHRTRDATFCGECKCYVCSNCDCKVYHLSYQEELWAETEEQDDKKKTAKKNRNKKKKEKAKQKKGQQQQKVEVEVPKTKKGKKQPGPSPTVGSDETSDGKTDTKETEASETTTAANTQSTSSNKNISGPENDDGNNENDKPEEEEQNQIDYVLYLQQTGSIIALAKLMDALEYNTNSDFDHDELARIRNDHAILNQ